MSVFMSDLEGTLVLLRGYEKKDGETKFIYEARPGSRQLMRLVTQEFSQILIATPAPQHVIEDVMQENFEIYDANWWYNTQERYYEKDPRIGNRLKSDWIEIFSGQPLVYIEDTDRLIDKAKFRRHNFLFLPISEWDGISKDDSEMVYAQQEIIKYLQDFSFAAKS